METEFMLVLKKTGTGIDGINAKLLQCGGDKLHERLLKY